MHSVKEIIEEAEALPVTDRAAIIDYLLQTLNSPKDNIEKAWIEVAKERLSEIRNGKAMLTPGEEVFARLNQRFG